MNVFLTIVLAVQMLTALGMIGLILVQHGKGADMGAAFGSGGSGSLFGASGSANFLSRTTAVLAAVIHTNGHCISEIAVAYEPVWAIGTGKTATPEQAQQVHAVLRAQLQAATAHAQRVSLLYGGSMNAANAASLLAQGDIDGGLIGGASLKAADFLQIIGAARTARA